MKVHCKTNLDLDREHWPAELPALPNIGDYILSTTRWGTFQLKLEVVSITWKQLSDGIEKWVPEIELHIRRSSNMSITDFYKWYAPKVGRQVSSFI